MALSVGFCNSAGTYAFPKFDLCDNSADRRRNFDQIIIFEAERFSVDRVVLRTSPKNDRLHHIS